MNIREPITIIVHDMVYGPPQALRDYLIQKKAARVVYVGLPFYEQKEEKLVVYEQGKKVSEKVKRHIVSDGIFSYVRDFFLVIARLWRIQPRVETAVCADPLTALSALFLRRFNLVKHVVLYTMDFTPVRFDNAFLNYVFHKVERYCVTRADHVWNVSPRMAKGREEFLGISSKKYPQVHVPVGIWNDKIKKVPYGKIKRHTILFIGHLIEKQGLQLIINAIPKILENIPDVKLVVIGGGEYGKTLKKLAKEKEVSSRVTFFGWVADRDEVYRLMSSCAVAVATYKPEQKKLRNFSYYADPGKIKNYLGAGIPVVLTDISYNAREIDKRKCGILVEYDVHAATQALMKLLSDDQLYKKYRKNALLYAQKLDWRIIFDALI